MFTACPHCDFLVTHLPAQPRPETCPRCGKPLHADGAAAAASAGAAAPGQADAPAAPPLATLLDAPAADAPGNEDTGAARSGEAATEAPAPAPASVAEASAAPASTVAPATAASVPTPASPAPAPTVRAPLAATAALRRHWQWPLLAALALLLGLQVLLADRARLAADPQWRPLVLQACALLRCSLPAWHEPSAFTMVERSVRPGQAAGTLRVDATFRNDARWAQAWPTLQLSLSDADGRTTGSGVFTPAQYLGEPPEGLLAPGQSAQVTFVVQEPAPGTVAFAFRFH
ncbi:DUF3426 domain-containing protein [Pseudoxanthomonas suwonensis]|uniref:DUF3426 domain-containing protein n=1 Tax=Pseudoxanthomonas suwonensis TaxID=314722 RepID=UPI0002E6A5A1|nr:DUF3426 domain-containing protein [Pseudoxanthomonas suwonensis]